MKSDALIAASQGANAVAALLRHEIEGFGFGDEPVIEMLAETLSLAIDLRMRETEKCDHEFRDALSRLQGEALAFLAEWAL